MRLAGPGSPIVSTSVLPRYRIGDLILAFGDGYFRCIGRERPFARLRYLWDSFWNWDFGRQTPARIDLRGPPDLGGLSSSWPLPFEEAAEKDGKADSDGDERPQLVEVKGQERSAGPNDQ